MKELTIKELRKVQLDMLKYFDAFCRKYGLKYSIGEGSLIGAVRHRGFIPWDDDVDVLMIRQEYEKFLELYQSERYPLLQASQNNEYWWPFVKIVDKNTKVVFNNGQKYPNGVWLTIFPIDHYPDHYEAWAKLKKKLNFISHLATVKERRCIGRTLITTIFRYFVIKYYPYHWLTEHFDKLIASYQKEYSKKSGPLCFWWLDEPFVCSSSAFENYVELPFEDMTVMAFGGYDEYLRCQYGDYMQMPPEEERIFSHDYRAYK